MKRSLLIGEYPVLVLPGLAMAVGLNEAIVLQQLHYWLGRSRHVREGKRWVYNSYEGWQRQFPWWSVDTVKRALRSLEDRGLITTGTFNRMKMDRTKWYTIDYAEVEALPLVQIAQDDQGNLHPPIPETTQRDAGDDNDAVFVPAGWEPMACVPSWARGE